MLCYYSLLVQKIKNKSTTTNSSKLLAKDSVMKNFGIGEIVEMDLPNKMVVKYSNMIDFNVDYKKRFFVPALLLTAIFLASFVTWVGLTVRYPNLNQYYFLFMIYVVLYFITSVSILVYRQIPKVNKNYIDSFWYFDFNEQTLKNYHEVSIANAFKEEIETIEIKGDEQQMYLHAQRDISKVQQLEVYVLKSDENPVSHQGIVKMKFAEKDCTIVAVVDPEGSTEEEYEEVHKKAMSCASLLAKVLSVPVETKDLKTGTKLQDIFFCNSEFDTK